MERLICVRDRICVWSDPDRISIWKKARHLDIRKKGSGNAGTTNVTAYYWAGKQERSHCLETALNASAAVVVSTSDLWKDTYRYDAFTCHVCRNGSSPGT